MEDHIGSRGARPATPACTWSGIDYAGPVMVDEPLPLTHQQRLELTAADDPPPGWVWPSLVLGAAWPALIASTRRDADLLRRLRPAPGPGRLGRIGELPGLPAAILVGTALALAVVFGFIRLGIHDTYPESWLFLVLALVLGIASPAAGLILVLAFMPMDLLAIITRGALDPIVPVLIAAAIGWWLLFLWAVALPLVARQVPAAVLAATRPVQPTARRALGYLGGMAVIAGLAWTWCAGAAELLSPVFTWSNALGDPTASATGPITDDRAGLAIAAALALLGWTLLRDTFAVIDDEAATDDAPPDWPRLLPILDRRLAPVRWVLVLVIGLVVLGGMITAPLDVLILGAALLAARPGVHWLLGRFPVALLLLGQVPWVVRLAAGVVGAWLAATILTRVVTEPALGSERLPIVLATAAGIVILALLLEADTVADDRMRASEARAAARPTGSGDGDRGDETDEAEQPPTADDLAAATARPVSVPTARLRPRRSRRAVTGLLGTVALLLLPAAALAQSGTPCPVGERCLPDASTMAAAASGAAALLTLSLGVAGRFVSVRRDVAIRTAALVGDPLALDAPPPSTARSAALTRVRGAIEEAWRAG